MSRVAVPVLARIADEGGPIRLSHLRRAQLVALYVTSSIFAILLALGTPLIVVVLGIKWRPPDHSSASCFERDLRSLVQVVYWIYSHEDWPGAQFRFYLVAQAAWSGGSPVACRSVRPEWLSRCPSATRCSGCPSLAWVRRVTKLNLGVLYADALRARSHCRAHGRRGIRRTSADRVSRLGQPAYRRGRGARRSGLVGGRLPRFRPASE